MRFLLFFLLLLAAPRVFGAQRASSPAGDAAAITAGITVDPLHSAPAAASDSAVHAMWVHKKLVAAILCLPPMGLVGLHRIYLHAQPWVPFVYLLTAGGCFGILPLIDFVVIVIQKPEDLKAFEGNSKVFMWEK